MTSFENMGLSSSPSRRFMFFLFLFCFFPLSFNLLGHNRYVKNPVICDYKCHDMSLLEGQDGFFYAAGTCIVARSDSMRVPYFGLSIFKSVNLENWTLHHTTNCSILVDSLRKKTNYKHKYNSGFYFSEKKDTVVGYPIWAPDLIWYGGRYLLYTALRRSYDDSKIVVFETDSLYKDFKFLQTVISNDSLDTSVFFNSREIIDPYPFEDDGKLFLLFGSFARNKDGRKISDRKGIGVYLARLDHSGTKIIGDPVFITDYFEGCSILKRNNRYFLFGSNGSIYSHTYKVNYAVSDSLFGPYRNTDGSLINDINSFNAPNAILETKESDRYNGLGCISKPVIDSNGRYWVLCHGHDLQLPPIEQETAERERYEFLLELKWDDNDLPYFDLEELETNKIRKPFIKTSKRKK